MKITNEIMDYCHAWRFSTKGKGLCSCMGIYFKPNCILHGWIPRNLGGFEDDDYRRFYSMAKADGFKSK